MNFQIEFFLSLVNVLLAELIRHTEEHWDAFWSAFPNPLAMLDIALSFFTGLLGVATAAPINAMEAMFIKRLRENKIHNRVMTLENAVRLAFQGHAELVRNVTFTDSSGIVGWLAQWIGSFLWRLSKNISLLRDLLGAKTQQEAIDAVLRALKKRVGLLRVVAAIIAVILVVETLGFLLWCVGLALFFVEGSATKLLLFPNRPRKRENKPTVQYRIGVGKS